jgi:enterochelin esterase-like enzyme
MGTVGELQMGGLPHGLLAKGYNVHYVEIYAYHDPVDWRRTLPDALISVLGR